MDVFISNLDSRWTRESLRDSLAPILLGFQIHVFEVRKAVGKTFATLTIADTSKAHNLLAQARADPKLLLSPSGRQATFRISQKAVDPHWLRVLRKEEKDRQSLRAWQKSSKVAGASQSVGQEAGLKFTALQLGRLRVMDKTEFAAYFELRTEGRLVRDGRTLVIRMNAVSSKRYDLVIDLSSILAFAVSGKSGASSTLMITLSLAPRIYEEHSPDPEDSLVEMLESLQLGRQMARAKFRVGTLPGLHHAIVGSCLTYSMVVSLGLDDLEHRIKSILPHRIPIKIMPAMSSPVRTGNYLQQLSRLQKQVARLGCSFAWRFQIHGLWANGLLSPGEVERLLPLMSDLRIRSGETTLITVLRRLNLQLPRHDATTNPQEAGFGGALNALTQKTALLFDDDVQRTSTRDQAYIHRVTVTPTGVYLYGPELIASNRILRQYSAHSDCFLRVLFSDENETRIEFDRDISNDCVYEDRFLEILRNGVDIAGEHFDFLGFSHSSLRSQTCWFMRPFIQDGTVLFASNLISKLGDFSEIRCPAKCAARIGQAFSETTSAVRVDPSAVQVHADVKVGRYVFTDGAKGMLTLDTRLEGDQIRLRHSMVKFSGSPSDEVEICGTNLRPLPFKLNRQIIKILEDLGVPASAFETLQEQAIQRLRLSASSRSVALNFIIQNLSDCSSGLPTLLRHLGRIGVDATEDIFLREILGALLQVQLREIKYRSRILVPNALTLYGISDETGCLEEGQVFVTSVNEETRKISYLGGRVTVTRSPALHPGDVQVVDAVAPPPDSPLWDLRNCIVFSQKGSRDLPSMLSGGDLDGDLYNIIYDEALMPSKTVAPAAYLPAQPIDIGRPVTANDMAGFFVDFMRNDQLGRIAIVHQVFADLDSTFSSNCLSLADLHSTAVDFSKSGVPVDPKKIPRSPAYRPDFMAPTASTKVEKGIKRPAAVDVDVTPNRGRGYRYYESDRVLGRLYRAVDEDTFFQDLEDETSSLFSMEASNNVLEDIRDWVVSSINYSQVQAYHTMASEVRDYYESNMLEMMSLYAVHRTEHLTEKEVFIGTIMGRSGAGSKHQREQSDYMKTQFNGELRQIKTWMEDQTADDGDDGFESLAAACLDVAVQEPSNSNVDLRSFGWFAAGLCVPEIVKRREGSAYEPTESLWAA
ncbi:hypothetical protein LTR46_008252 [Exophiala xenobiotica]|nr:hypothetical protein LTR46_008252 [Exophiala xenobiotica]